jgi:aminoglycoside 3-N-acetyltransferase
MTTAQLVRGLIESSGSGPVFVHSDPFRVARLLKPVRDRAAYLDSHIALLREASGDRGLWLPTFNYDFPRTHVFDVRESESQLGPIPERFRVAAAEWRTHIPMFSISGIGSPVTPQWGDHTDPFGRDSFFAKLVENDGVIVYYGDTFHYNTLVHFAERVAGGPAYRYDKLFEGRVIDEEGASFEGSLDYHVRPLGMGLDYDWPRLLNEALEAGVCRRLEGYPAVLAASARALNELWVSDMKGDPFALLDEKSRAWAEPAVEKLGRRFVLTDYEGAEVTT